MLCLSSLNSSQVDQFNEPTHLLSKFSSRRRYLVGHQQFSDYKGGNLLIDKKSRNFHENRKHIFYYNEYLYQNQEEGQHDQLLD